MFKVWLREQMDAAGLVEDDVARALGITQQAVSRWLNGESRPGPKRQAALALILEVPLGDLMAVMAQDVATVERWDSLPPEEPVTEIEAELADLRARMARLERRLAARQRRPRGSPSA